MEQPLDIREVVRRTGLTSRALRFYEARGLLRPLRTYSGRRLFGRGELERIQQILALKRAGLTLSQIAELAERGSPDLGALIDAQLKLIDGRKAELDEARTMLLTVKSRIDRGEPVDAATFCSLIRNGETIMQSADWKTAANRYFMPEHREGWAEKLAEVPAEFLEESYGRKWAELACRIEGALPLDPSSAQAQAFVDEWFVLLKPFSGIATPEMWKGTVRMYDDMDNWNEGERPFPKQVWDFIRAATRARFEAGGKVDGPPWMGG